jgi:hypothetical protein
MTRNMRRKCASSEQMSGRQGLFHRLSVAAGGRTVRLVLDPPKSYPAALLVSPLVAVLIVGLCLILAVLHPAVQAGSLRVLADRASGGLYDAPEGCR